MPPEASSSRSQTTPLMEAVNLEKPPEASSSRSQTVGTAEYFYRLLCRQRLAPRGARQLLSIMIFCTWKPPEASSSRSQTIEIVIFPYFEKPPEASSSRSQTRRQRQRPKPKKPPEASSSRSQTCLPCSDRGCRRAARG